MSNLSNNKEEEKIPQQIQKIMAQTQEDFDKIGAQQRFGFFSIPPNQIIGDRFYSKKNEFNHKVVDRKVISEKRGIFTTIGKSGRTHDAYFLSYDTTDEGVQERLKQGWIDDNKKHLEKVEEFKNKIPTPVFKYPGVQHYKDEFDQHPFERNYPLTKDPPKHYQVIEGKVIGEKRGIFTQPMKKGLNNTPGIYFSYAPFHENRDENIAKIHEARKKKRPQSSIPLQRAYKKAFFPASLKKNECFGSIKDTFGYEDGYYANLKQQSDQIRKNRKEKYSHPPPKGSAPHDRPFTPSHLGKFGRDGLFDQRIWDCPQKPEKRVIINQRERCEYERSHRKTPFYYNKMQVQTKFSPSITGNTLNMRRDYPTIYKK